MITRPTPTGDDLPLAMAHVLIEAGADPEDAPLCIFTLIGGPAPFLAREINAHVDEAMALARGMRAEAREAA